MMYRLLFTSQANKDARRISKSNLRKKVEQLLNLLKEDPFRNPPTFKELTGELKGAYSRRINIQHRLVYQVLEEKRIVKIVSMWDHYV